MTGQREPARFQRLVNKMARAEEAEKLALPDPRDVARQEGDVASLALPPRPWGDPVIRLFWWGTAGVIAFAAVVVALWASGALAFLPVAASAVAIATAVWGVTIVPRSERRVSSRRPEKRSKHA